MGIVNKFVSKQCLKLSLVTNTIGTDIQNQKEGVAIILAELEEKF